MRHSTHGRRECVARPTVALRSGRRAVWEDQSLHILLQRNQASLATVRSSNPGYHGISKGLRNLTVTRTAPRDSFGLTIPLRHGRGRSRVGDPGVYQDHAPQLE